MNCGRNAEKNSKPLGLDKPTNKARKKAERPVAPALTVLRCKAPLGARQSTQARYSRYTAPTHLTTLNSCSEACSNAPRPQPTAAINSRSESIAPAMPKPATRMPWEAPLFRARSIAGPGVIITALAAIT
ncbi:hypothetical protein D3C81_480810 [compost metagenome]